MTEETETKELEVLYSEGATKLFSAIEETDWRQALDLTESHPEQVRTWVRSTGTENTTFAWSMWRRLPIHEACRRQAPAWLVSSLFSSFPESAYLTTQFGELPLHLAVESGAAPEVVNLIMVANWEAIVTPDNSGRIPTDILDRGELLMLDDHRIVHESLSRCHLAYSKMQKITQEEQGSLQRKHKAQMTTVKRQHQEALRKDKQKQDELTRQVEMLKSKITDIECIESAKESSAQESQVEMRVWKEKVQSLTATVELLQEELLNERKKLNAVVDDLEEKDHQLRGRDEVIQVLSNDLRNVSLMHDEDLMESVRSAEHTMRAMVSSQIALQKQLAGNANGLKALLSARGIEPRSIAADRQQEEKDSLQEDPVDPTDAASALAAAAMAALKPAHPV